MGHLILSRRRNESVKIGNDITVQVVDIRGNVARLSFDAPNEVVILRSEIVEAIQREQANQKGENDVDSK